MLIFLFILFSCTSAFTYPHVNMKLNRNSIQVATMNDITLMKTTDDKNDANQSAFSRITKLLEEADKDDKKKPPIYEPNSYPTHVISALAYLIPIVDASDVGKYMFEAYPSVSQVYNTAFGPLTSVYNGIPFLPFVIYFGMSYICRAPTFPVEVRFHFAQAFMLSIIQFLPVLGLGLLEKAGVPGLGIFYNTRKFT